MEPLSICLVSQEYPPETARGGIGTQAHAKAHGLARLGHRVHVVSRNVADGRTLEYGDGPVRVTRVPGLERQFPIHTTLADWVTYSSQVAAAVSRIHERTPLDVLEFPEWACEAYVHLLDRVQWNHIPTLIHLHGPLVMLAHALGWPELDSEFYRSGTAMEGACLRMADQVFSSSKSSAAWCAKHYGLDAARIPTIHTGVDTELFRPRGSDARPADKHPLTIAFAGNISTSKGVDLLARAAMRLAPEMPGLRVKLFGTARKRLPEQLCAEAAAGGLPGLLHFAGFADRPTLARELAGADLFVAPSDYEGGPGLVYLEAMACGLPVIACECPGVAEVLTGGDNGLLVPSRDIDSLTEAMRTLLIDHEQRQRMGERAREYVLRTADSRDCIRRLEALYAAVAGKPAGAKDNRDASAALHSAPADSPLEAAATI
jgi:glycosyltransferase involved in cell wall biosynthesis